MRVNEKYIRNSLEYLSDVIVEGILGRRSIGERNNAKLNIVEHFPKHLHRRTHAIQPPKFFSLKI